MNDVAVVDSSTESVVSEIVRQWLSKKSGEPLTLDRGDRGDLVITAGYAETEITQMKARQMLGGISHGTFYRRYVMAKDLSRKIKVLENRKVRMVDVLRAQGRIRDVDDY